MFNSWKPNMITGLMDFKTLAFKTASLYSKICNTSNSQMCRWFSTYKRLDDDAITDQCGKQLTHVDDHGKIKMINIKDKSSSVRVATAEAIVQLGPVAFALVQQNKMKKGDVITTAKLAGILAAKKTSDLIPLCHNILTDGIDVEATFIPNNQEVMLQSHVTCIGRTGAEMEALTAVSIAALTIYDMCKAVSKDIVIKQIRLLSKTGGKEDFVRDEI